MSRYNSQKFPKFFHEIILEILCNNLWNLPNLFLKIFKQIFKNFDNICSNFPKYFSKFSEKIVQIFQNDLILKILLNNSWKLLKYFSKFSEKFWNISRN